MFRLVLATRNPGKVEEIRQLLGASKVEVLTPDAFPAAPEVQEDADTLEGNAEKKAVALLRHTGIPALADDTGLEVDALDGRPGVHSARFAGEACDDRANRRLLLATLEGRRDRSARFKTIMALALTEHDVRYFAGVCEGEILEEERGSGGFGYDALFRPLGETRTFAEMPSREKGLISHRGRALRKVMAFLRGAADQTGPR